MTTRIEKINTEESASTTINLYDGLKCLVADSPEDLCNLINSIKIPIKIFQFVGTNNRHVCYFKGDVKIKKTNKRSK